MGFADDMAEPEREHDPLDAFPSFVARVRERLEAGRAAYGDASFERPAVELGEELAQEALDLAGWGFVLFVRLQELKKRAARLDEQHAAETRPVRGDW